MTQYDNVVNEKEGNQMVIGVNCGHTLSGAGSGAVGMISESAVSYTHLDVYKRQITRCQLE